MWIKLRFKTYTIEHGYNMHEKIPEGMTKVVNWKEIYEIITGDSNG